MAAIYTPAPAPLREPHADADDAIDIAKAAA
jgi:hypothetical protein